jgi:hypothetical protein
MQQVRAEKMHPLLAVDDQAEEDINNEIRPQEQNTGWYICSGLVCNIIRHTSNPHRRGMERSKSALCEGCWQHRRTVVMAYDTEQTLQHLPEALQEIAAARVGKRVAVVKTIASQLECGTMRWSNHARVYQTACQWSDERGQRGIPQPGRTERHTMHWKMQSGG